MAAAGWHAGLIIPSSNRLIEQEMVPCFPKGLVPHVTRLRMTGTHRVSLAMPGQTIMQQANYLPSSPEIPALLPRLKPDGGVFKGTVLSPALIAARLGHWNDVFNALFR